MRKTVAKKLRKAARALAQVKNTNVEQEYKKLKSVYKSSKGQI
jgi:hypothetical protein